MNNDDILQPIDRLLHAIAPLRDEMAILSAAAEILRTAGIGDGATVALLDDVDSSLSLHFLTIPPASGHVPKVDSIDINDGFFQDLIDLGEVTVWNGGLPDMGDGGASAEVATEINLLGIRAGAIVPLRASEMTLGVITFLSLREDDFAPDSHGGLLRIGDILGLALEKARLIARLERELAQSTATAERLRSNNRDLEEFAYVASHDLQEPLRKIRAFSDRLESKAAERLTEQDSDYLGRVQNAAGRMQSLIGDLLAYSRVNTDADGGGVPVDLDGLVAGVLSDLEVAIAESGTTVRVGDLPAIEGDPTQLRQLFQNLIGNAIKFRADGTPPVIHVGATRTDGGDIELSVRDNGIGFEDKYLDRIFKPFQRLHGRGDYSGSGIGLAVCKKIAERHSGILGASSTPGCGATFTLTMPADRLAVLESAPAS